MWDNAAWDGTRRAAAGRVLHRYAGRGDGRGPAVDASACTASH